jgi:hypothetical protein
VDTRHSLLTDPLTDADREPDTDDRAVDPAPGTDARPGPHPL